MGYLRVFLVWEMGVRGGRVRGRLLGTNPGHLFRVWDVGVSKEDFSYGGGGLGVLILGTLAEPCSLGCLQYLPGPPLRCQLFLSTAPLTDHCTMHKGTIFSIIKYLPPGPDLAVVAPVHVFKIPHGIPHLS